MFIKLAIFMCACLISGSVFAGDRIGNGAGLWTCKSSDKTIRHGELVDLFEARQEFQLYVPSTGMGTTPQEVYLAAKLRIAALDPALHIQLEPYFTRVEQNLIYVEAALALVDDSLWRISPLPQDCNGGTWEYTQFANFTNYDRILIRQDLWNSSKVSSLDKAALLVHEAVYLFLRETAGDTDSVRTRQITGLLFSNLPGHEVQLRVQSVLNNATTGPSPAPLPTPAQRACRITNSYTYQTYIGTGLNEVDAQYEALSTCQNAGTARYCLETDLTCDTFSSLSPVISCRVDNSYTHKSFMGRGRSKVEAEGLALIECQKGGTSRYCAIQKCSQ